MEDGIDLVLVGLGMNEAGAPDLSGIVRRNGAAGLENQGEAQVSGVARGFAAAAGNSGSRTRRLG